MGRLDKKVILFYLVFIILSSFVSARVYRTLTEDYGYMCKDTNYTIKVEDPGAGYNFIENLLNGWTYTKLAEDALTDCIISSTQIKCARLGTEDRNLVFFVSNNPGNYINVFNGKFFDKSTSITGEKITGLESIEVKENVCITDEDKDGYSSGTALNACGCKGENDCCDSGNEVMLGCTVETRSNINPSKKDIPGNNIDENCDGKDEKLPSIVSRDLPEAITDTIAVYLNIQYTGGESSLVINERFEASKFRCVSASNNGVCSDDGKVQWNIINLNDINQVYYTLKVRSQQKCYYFNEGTFLFSGRRETGILGEAVIGIGCIIPNCNWVGREICGNDIDEDCDGNKPICELGCTITNSAVEICGNNIDEDCIDGYATCFPGCTPCNVGYEICGNDIDEDCDGIYAACVDTYLQGTCIPTNNGIEICGNGRDEDCNGFDDVCDYGCPYRGEEICGNNVDENCDTVKDYCIVTGCNPTGEEICNYNGDENCDGITRCCFDCSPKDSGLGLGYEECGNNIDENCDGIPEPCCTDTCIPAIEKCGNGYDEDCNCMSEACMPCELTSVTITPQCGLDNCGEGEQIRIDVTYSGCPARSFIQVDASATGCRIQNSEYDIQGMSILCTSSPCTDYWSLPSIPSQCNNKRIKAIYASLYDISIAPDNYITGPITPSGYFDIGKSCESILEKNGLQLGNEICDNIDNDCDGRIDNWGVLQDYTLTRQCGLNNAGICRLGEERCAFINEKSTYVECNAVWPENCLLQRKDQTNPLSEWICANIPEETSTMCDNKDNDCDGRVDDNIIANCGIINTYGNCQGTKTCKEGVTGAAGTSQWNDCSTYTKECKTTEYSEYSSCTYPLCATSGSQSRTVTEYKCSLDGVCTKIQSTQDMACTRNSDNLACDDNNLCTSNDRCNNQQCTGTPMTCADQYCETNNYCSGGACYYSKIDCNAYSPDGCCPTNENILGHQACSSDPNSGWYDKDCGCTSTCAIPSTITCGQDYSDACNNYCGKGTYCSSGTCENNVCKVCNIGSSCDDGNPCTTNDKYQTTSCNSCSGTLIPDCASESNCGDGIDNDNDNLIDCADNNCNGKTCATGKTCQSGSCCSCSGTSCNPNNNGQVCDGCNYVAAPAEVCGDGIDNDCDGSVDSSDTNCPTTNCGAVKFCGSVTAIYTCGVDEGSPGKGGTIAGVCPNDFKSDLCPPTGACKDPDC